MEVCLYLISFRQQNSIKIYDIRSQFVFSCMLQLSVTVGLYLEKEKGHDKSGFD